MKAIKSKFEEMTNKLNKVRSGIEIVAVTKQVGTVTTQEAVDAGIRHIGENRPEGLKHKRSEVKGDVAWHYIGALQSRKVKEVIDSIDYLHSLDRMSLAKEIQKRASKRVKCFVQVNVSGEDSKSGFAPEQVRPFVESLKDFDKIEIVGLMTMAPNTDDENVLRATFKGLKTLQRQIAEKQWQHAPCTELSMGMSNDYLIAADEGATFVRVGTALVGSESEAQR
ncbi:YggS family pyridoxal phosphate-dependent enzyme [Planococcus dechangensis]|uniref:Pyridoxal phosphate homeostasis protein n=1 Tax=Planococcus dechangensis TaxID=1176255 RepID=A0ABV9MBR7_9BACL